MTSTDLSLLAIALIGLLLFTRGCHRLSPADCLIGLLIGAFSAAAYFVFLTLTRVEYLAATIFCIYLLAILRWPHMRSSRLGQSMIAVCIVLIAATGLLRAGSGPAWWTAAAGL